MYSVLIVEDNHMHLEIEKELLENAGFDVLKTNNAISGIKIAQNSKPDIILMDMNLPDLDGYNATMLLKKDYQTQDIPVVATTALVMKNEVAKAINAGCSGFISKPIDISNFVQTVKNYVESKIIFESTDEIYNQINKTFQHVKHYSDFKKDDTGTFEVNKKTHKILIVDDNPINAELLKETVEQLNKIAFIAYGGKKAIELAQNYSFDLILLDIMMPEISGFELIKKLKNDVKNTQTPVIFISALNDTKDIVKGLDLGSYDYITKPYNIDELKARVSSVLRIKDLQDELRQEKEKFDQINKFSADGIIILNSEFEITSCSDRFIEWMGINKDDNKNEIIGKNLFKLIQNSDENVQFYNSYLNSNSLDFVNPESSDLQSFDPKNSDLLKEFTIKHSDKIKYIEINSSKMQNNKDETEGYVLVLRDISAQKEVEKQKETFIATLTHDLKTPIRAEMRSLELLLKGSFGELTSDQKEIINEILLSSKFMSGMVNTLLAGYKYDNGKVDIHKDKVDLNEIIKLCNSELKYLVQEKNQNLTFEHQNQNQIIYADYVEIKRLVTNLLSNALNYTSEGGTITIISEIENAGIENKYVKVSVIDNGRGISQSQIPHLFDKYTSYSKKFRQVGTGLGLYVAKQILEAHDGHITVKSEEGKGSEFTFYLPLNEKTTL